VVGCSSKLSGTEVPFEKETAKMEIRTFTVLSGGQSFQTSDLDLMDGDTAHAFFKAHLHAARQAANLHAAFYVIRDDTGDKRYGFGSMAMLHPASYLYKIMQMGLESYWNYAETAWVPLEEEEDTMLIAQSTSRPEMA
jgi:hypothetical protein